MVFSTWAGKLHFLPKIRKFHEISNILVILVKLSLFGEKRRNRTFPAPVGLKILENSQKTESILRILHFLWKFHIFNLKFIFFTSKVNFPSMSEIPSITKRFYRFWRSFSWKINIFEKIALFSEKSTFPLKSEKYDFHTFSRFHCIFTKTPKIPLEISSPNRPGREKHDF